MAIMAWSVHNVWIAGGAMGLTFLLAFVMLWRLIDFADRNPKAALLEGAEFVLHEQIVHASKANPRIPEAEIVKVQPEPLPAALDDPAIASVPDEEVKALENGGDNQ
ncbi:hypothetical protein WS51_12675 [Burkholderia territorii]|nr:hypothetical protein WS51_12675 [Burkholderia territorii]